MVTVRTIPKVTEIIYAALVAMFPAISVALFVAAVVSRASFVILPGIICVFFGTGAYNLPIIRTASRLSLDVGGDMLGWSATVGNGEIPIRSIISIVRSKRPTVYEIRTTEGERVPFWLGTRNPAVRDFFEQLSQANPGILMTDLHRKRHLWWSGLPAA